MVEMVLILGNLVSMDFQKNKTRQTKHNSSQYHEMLHGSEITLTLSSRYETKIGKENSVVVLFVLCLGI